MQDSDYIGISNVTYTYLGNASAELWIDREEAKEREKNMRGLFEVFVVDPETEDVRLHVFVIATDETKARLKAIQKGLRDSLLVNLDDLDDFDVLARRLGDIRPKVEIQQVRMVTETK